MTKRVLDVGNCGFDHGSIRRLCERHFRAEVQQASGERDAIERLRRETFALVIVNRVFDADYGSGVELIHRLKADPQLKEIPVMLLSNYPQYQAQAVEAGAVPGFGKSDLAAPSTVERLRTYLGEPSGASA